MKIYRPLCVHANSQCPALGGWHGQSYVPAWAGALGRITASPGHRAQVTPTSTSKALMPRISLHITIDAVASISSETGIRDDWDGDLAIIFFQYPSV